MATTATSTGILFPNGTTQTFAPGVKSVQSIFANPYGTVTGGDFTRSVNITIAAVDITKCIIFFPTWLQYYDNGYTSFAWISVKLLNSTTVQLSQSFSYNTQRAFRFQIIEFK